MQGTGHPNPAVIKNWLVFELFYGILNFHVNKRILQRLALVSGDVLIFLSLIFFSKFLNEVILINVLLNGRKIN